MLQARNNKNLQEDTNIKDGTEDRFEKNIEELKPLLELADCLDMGGLGKLEVSHDP